MEASGRDNRREVGPGPKEGSDRRKAGMRASAHREQTAVRGQMGQRTDTLYQTKKAGIVALTIKHSTTLEGGPGTSLGSHPRGLVCVAPQFPQASSPSPYRLMVRCKSKD